MNINPVDMAVKEWCDRMVLELGNYGQAPFLQDEAKWQDWGQQVCLLPGVAAFNPPNPSLFFDDFYLWATQFNLAVPL